MAGRSAAVAPGSADTLAAFAGVYQTHQLPDCAGKPADAGFELSITMDAAGDSDHDNERDFSMLNAVTCAAWLLRQLLVRPAHYN